MSTAQRARRNEIVSVGPDLMHGTRAFAEPVFRSVFYWMI
jgi:hypothetical protein